MAVVYSCYKFCSFRFWNGYVTIVSLLTLTQMKPKTNSDWTIVFQGGDNGHFYYLYGNVYKNLGGSILCLGSRSLAWWFVLFFHVAVLPHLSCCLCAFYFYLTCICTVKHGRLLQDYRGVVVYTKTTAILVMRRYYNAPQVLICSPVSRFNERLNV